MTRRLPALASGALPACLAAAVALIVTVSLIAEISSVPTADPSIHSSTWTPATALSALFFGPGAYEGDFAVLPIAFGWLVMLVGSIAFGLLWSALIVYSLGWRPHPVAAAILGAACGLATEILAINLLLNWLQAENGVYRSLPSWGWWVGMGAWGIALGLTLSRAGAVPAPQPVLGRVEAAP